VSNTGFAATRAVATMSASATSAGLDQPRFGRHPYQVFSIPAVLAAAEPELAHELLASRNVHNQ